MADAELIPASAEGLVSSISIRQMVWVAFFTALTAVGAWIAVPLPFSPVPIALASLFALLSGAILGKWLGALSQSVYVLMGLAGIPVFARFTAGPGIVAGPTGGYLAGYIAGAFVAGMLVEYLPVRRMAVRFAVGLTAGTMVIYAVGVPWLALVTGMNLTAAMVVGMYPFLPGDALKVLMGVVLCLGLVGQSSHVWSTPAAKDLARQSEND